LRVKFESLRSRVAETEAEAPPPETALASPCFVEVSPRSSKWARIFSTTRVSVREARSLRLTSTGSSKLAVATVPPTFRVYVAARQTAGGSCASRRGALSAVDAEV
jgi:hypothetical protein